MSTRTDKFRTLIKKEVSRIIREDVSDPRIGFISITDVDISPDLRNAKVFVSILGESEQKTKAMDGLTSATGFIKGRLGEIIKGRVVPDLQFILDNSLERGSKVLSLISKIENERTRPPKKNKKRSKKS